MLGGGEDVEDGELPDARGMIERETVSHTPAAIVHRSIHMEPTGLEPVASAMPWRRSPN